MNRESVHLPGKTLLEGLLGKWRSCSTVQRRSAPGEGKAASDGDIARSILPLLTVYVVGYRRLNRSPS
jgi:hypothetical protein